MSATYAINRLALEPSAAGGAFTMRRVAGLFDALFRTPFSVSAPRQGVLQGSTKRVSSIGSAALVSTSHLEDEFSEYETYDFPDWDGYGASPIAKDTVDAARAFQRLLPREVPTPDIAPGADGTIGFEWSSGPASARTLMFVDIGPDDLITASIVRVDGSVEVLPPTRMGEGDRALIRLLFP